MKHFEGTNALPIWTMTDLLQINGNGLNQMGTTPKDSICPAAQLHTKRYLNSMKTLSPSTSSSLADAERPTNLNHKRPSAIDTNSHKRMKNSIDNNASIRMHQTRQQSQQNNYMRAYQIAKNQQQQQQNPSAPHLLQQLMAPMTRKHNTNTNVDDTQWTRNNGKNQQMIYQQNGNDLGNANNMQQASNSVLKNLLVSGCDINAGYICNIPKRAAKA